MAIDEVTIRDRDETTGEASGTVNVDVKRLSNGTKSVVREVACIASPTNFDRVAEVNANSELLTHDAGLDDVATETTLAAISTKVDALTTPSDTQQVSIAGAVPVTDNSGSLTVDGTVAVTNANLDAAISTLAKETGGNLDTIAGKDFATQTTLALIKAKTDNLDVALSTRTKPADSQTVTGTVGVTNANLDVALSTLATQTTLAAIKAKTDNIDVALSTRTKPADTQVVGDGGGAISVDDNGANLSIDDGGNNISVDDGGNVISVDDASGSLTVDNGGTFAIQDSEKLADNAGFTDGTTKLIPCGYIYDEVAGTTLTENDIAAPRINANRASVSTIEDGSTRGRYATVTAANALKVDASGVAVPITDNSGSVTVDNGGTFAVQDSEKIADNAGFTDGTTKLTPCGFIFDETAGTSLTENDIAAARVDSKRATVFVIEDETTRGRRATVTASNALKVDASAVAVPITDNSGSLTVDNNGTFAVQAAIGATSKTPLFASISVASSGSNQIVAADASNKIKVIAYAIVADGAVTAKWQNASTDLSGAMSLAANGGIAHAAPAGYWLMETSTNSALNLNLGGAIGVRGYLLYIKESS